MKIKKTYKYLVGFLAIYGFFQLFTFSKEVILKTIEKQEFYAAKSHDISGDFDFCGEPVPTQSVDISERLDKEILKNSFWHSQILLYYKRTGKYFPIIEPILKKNNIPNDFKYLAVIESGLTNAVSPAGARGFWQIMEKTGKEYGLEINKEIDERYHLIKSTEAACKYLNASYKRFGSWTLVAASYNMGMGGVARRMKQQKVNNYYDLLLNSETSRYVFRIVAVKDILSNPRKYGYKLNNNEKYKDEEFDIITIDSTINSITDFAIQNNLNYKILKLSNPWIKLKRITNPKKKTYSIKIPKNGYHIYSDYDCYLHNDSSNLTDSLRLILCNDSNTSMQFDSNSLKNSILSDSLPKEAEIETKK